MRQSPLRLVTEMSAPGSVLGFHPVVVILFCFLGLLSMRAFVMSLERRLKKK